MTEEKKITHEISEADNQLLIATKELLQVEKTPFIKQQVLEMYIAYNDSDIADSKEDRQEKGAIFFHLNTFFNNIEDSQKKN